MDSARVTVTVTVTAKATATDSATETDSARATGLAMGLARVTPPGSAPERAQGPANRRLRRRHIR
jgi:hypothetical protein